MLVNLNETSDFKLRLVISSIELNVTLDFLNLV